jgi:hypothetical protein
MSGQRLEGTPACSAQALEAGELELRRHGRGARSVDQGPAVLQEGSGEPLDGRAGIRAGDGLRPEGIGVGIDAQDQL